MSEHLWARENLAVYVVGGLDETEAQRIERHLTQCAECKQEHDAILQMEQIMDRLYNQDRPDAGMEDRVIAGLRNAPRNRPGIARFLAAAAAVIVLGLFGAGLQALAINGNLSFTKTSRTNGFVKEGMHEGKPGGGNFLAGWLGDESRVEMLQAVDDERHVNTDREDGESTKGLVELHNGRAMGGGKADPEEKSPASTNQGANGRAGAGEIAKQREWRFEPGKPQWNVERDGDGKAAVTNRPLPSILNNSYSELTNQGLKDGKGPPAGGANVYYIQPDTRMPVLPPVPLSLTAPKTEPLGKTAQPNKNPSQVMAQNLVEKKQVPLSNESTSLKIIRTGEVEFEVESFDAAAEAVKKLVGKIKEGTWTVSDDKRLPNGKKQGFVIVRMPPQFLDAYIVDLRRELGKTAQLKTQRIGSQDVTKQYIDNEAELRNARITEQRYLDIIKNGKGDIKDLVLAENALAVWRTKIDKLEGSKRYYDNQVALSTLTVHLTENEILTPAALVVNEKNGLQIEVEDVEKAQASALAAVAEAKGRVLKSEVKQHAFGHLKAIVHAEIAPAAARAFAERLKKLGIVTHQDLQRKQEAQGGSGPPKDLTPKLNDVQFEIELYNAANIEPREAIKMLIATQDVQGKYRKLREAIAAVKGHLVDANLDEQDRNKVVAQIDFDIFVQDKPAIDKQIADLGPVIARSTAQAPAKKLVTDQKVGYRLILRNVAGVEPREKIGLSIVEVADVGKSVKELKDLVIADKGMILDSRSKGEVNGQTTATLTFEVPLGAFDSLVGKIKKSGTVRSQQAEQNSRAPDNELATGRIEVVLVSTGPIVPSDEGLGTQIRTGLYISFKVLAYSLMCVIIGIGGILPFVLVIWAAFKLMRRFGKGVPQ